MLLRYNINISRNIKEMGGRDTEKAAENDGEKKSKTKGNKE